MKSQVILAIPDIHFPFHHRKTFSFLEEIKKTFRPNEVICLGDELDLYRLSKYVQDPDGMSHNEEMNRALGNMQILYKMFPEVKSCYSNHLARINKRAQEAGIPSMFIRNLSDWMRAPKGWKWAEQWVIPSKKGPILFYHGEPYSSSNWHRAALELHENVVLGHVHANAGVYHLRNRVHELWTLNTGCLIDPDQYAFAYAKNVKFRPIIGCGIIIDGVPQFIPLE